MSAPKSVAPVIAAVEAVEPERTGTFVRFPDSPFELFRCLADPVWHGKELILEEFLPGSIEYVTHGVCRGGRVLWNHTFA